MAIIIPKDNKNAQNLLFGTTIFKTDECVVCLEKFTDKNRPLKCYHWIHKKCIINSGKDQCPICRVTNVGLNTSELKKLKKVNLRMKRENEREERRRLEEEENSSIRIDRIPPGNIQEMRDLLFDDVMTIIDNPILTPFFFIEDEQR